MNQVNNIILKHDDSVDKKIRLTAQKLHRKYSKKRTVNEKVLKKKTPLQKALSIFGNSLCILFAVFCLFFCFCNISSVVQNIVPTFAGYSSAKVSSGSMVTSGYEIGQNIVIKSVDTNTLKKDDIIAFYVFEPSFANLDRETLTLIEVDDSVQIKSNLTFAKFFGIQNKQIQTAAKSKSKFVFHHIKEIYQDENGNRWFSTYGSSNGYTDDWLINENYVVGINDNSSGGRAAANFITFATSWIGITIFLILPIGLLVLVGAGFIIRYLQIRKLILDIVEEKRKITDDICVKNKIGFKMDNKTKYKVLAQAENADDINVYLSLLWKDGSAPTSIRKYYTRKKILLKSNADLKNLNRQCEEMFAKGEDPKKIAKFYEESKAQIKNEYETKQKRIKSIKIS